MIVDHHPTLWNPNPRTDRQAEQQQRALESWGQDLTPGDIIRIRNAETGEIRAEYLCGLDFKTG
jgi:hypothetical protein